jgi:hypothetical protein
MRSAYILLAFAAVLLTACTSTTSNIALVNDAASLPSSFNFGKMGFKVITSFINKKQGTMSTLYGNELALKTTSAGTGTIIVGEVFALVTWKQQADDHWFGAKIPANLLSVEYVKTGEGSNHISYQKFEGKNLVLSMDTSNNQNRIKYIFDQKPSVMP